MSSYYLIKLSDGSKDYWWPAEHKEDKKKEILLSSMNTNLIVVKTIVSNQYMACDLNNKDFYVQYSKIEENKEQNETFLNKIHACLDKFEDIKASNLNIKEKENFYAIRKLIIHTIDGANDTIKYRINDFFYELESFKSVKETDKEINNKKEPKGDTELKKKQRRKDKRKQIQKENKFRKQQQQQQQLQLQQNDRQKPTGIVLKRSDVIAWDDYFMAVAFLSSMRSKDPSTQVGACIVDTDNRIIGIGYNGFPRGCSDDVLSWAREAENELDTKYPYVCHAEVNAILNKNIADARGCTIYVALFPCNECAKMIIQSGISEVVFLSDKYHNTPSMTASRRMFNLAGVKQRQLTPNKETIEICFECSPTAVTATSPNVNGLPSPNTGIP